MEASKIALSKAEEQLIANAEIILTKNHAIEKIVTLFSSLAESYRQQSTGPAARYPQHFSVHPKISKGEKHHGLPWVMLDYPRTFSNKDGHVAVRTFFWWGNFFSIQLHISGRYLQNALPAINRQQDLPGWLTGFTDDPWDLQLPNDKWQPLANVALENGRLFYKMAKKIPISGWETVLDFFPECYSELLPLIEVALGAKSVE